jgi:lipopolysaccharide/colanic/teichoic acid biosynthesis glycosyltransferase
LTFYRRRGKRAFDTVASAVSLLVWSPVFLAVALLVRLLLGAPVLFRQDRPGLGGRPFALLKFRTMTDARDSAGTWLPDERRLTRFGRFLRRSSLDELPELWNVLRGDMSLVGPRPLLMQYLTRYTPQQARRHEVSPGITGLAQVDGRNSLPWDERLRLDVTYVDSVSFALDLMILLRTVWTVLSREGISADGCATMAEFMGQGPEPQDSMTKRKT